MNSQTMQPTVPQTQYWTNNARAQSTVTFAVCYNTAT